MAHAFCACALRSSQDGTRGTMGQRANRRLTDSQASRRVAFNLGPFSGNLNKSLIRDGAPRSMKVGTTRSPWRYDAAIRHALQSANLRLPAILHYASSAAVSPISQGGPVTLR
jgi:hypothetical protein